MSWICWASCRKDGSQISPPPCTRIRWCLPRGPPFWPDGTASSSSWTSAPPQELWWDCVWFWRGGVQKRSRFNQTFLKFFELFSSFQCLISYCDFSATPPRRGWFFFCAAGWQHGRDDVRRGVPRTVQMSRWPGATLSSPRNWSAFQTKDLYHNFGLFINNWSRLASGQYASCFKATVSLKSNEISPKWMWSVMRYSVKCWRSVTSFVIECIWLCLLNVIVSQ